MDVFQTPDAIIRSYSDYEPVLYHWDGSSVVIGQITTHHFKISGYTISDRNPSKDKAAYLTYQGSSSNASKVFGMSYANAYLYQVTGGLSRSSTVKSESYQMKCMAFVDIPFVGNYNLTLNDTEFITTLDDVAPTMEVLSTASARRQCGAERAPQQRC